MEFVAISPIHILPEIAAKQRLHLVLAQLLESDAEYAAHYRLLRAQGDYIILDNGAYELGRAVNEGLMIKWANWLQAQEVVLPDVMRDRRGTYNRTTGAMAQWAQEMPYVERFMVVPQGNSVAEWLQSFHELNRFAIDLFGDYYDNLAYGVAKHTTRWNEYGTGRLAILDALRQELPVGVPVHLLGSDDRLQEPAALVESGHAGWIRSMDSAKPIIYAIAGQLLHFEGAPDPNCTYKRPADYFFRGLSARQRRYAFLNVAIVNSWLRAGVPALNSL